MDQMSWAAFHIKMQMAAVEAAEAALAHAVIEARQYGETWKSIGKVLGVSAQAAHQRFGVPAAVS